MAEEEWARLAKTDRPTLGSEVWQRWGDLLESDPEAVLQDPALVAAVFLTILSEDVGAEDRLRALVATETLDEWGDFSEARARLAQLTDWSFPTVASPGPVPELAYVHLLADVQESFVSDDDQVVFADATLALYRREGEWWRVLAFGTPEI